MIKIRQLSRDKQILKMKLENQSYKLNQLKKRWKNNSTFEKKEE